MSVQIYTGPRPSEDDIIRPNVSTDEMMRHLQQNGYDIQKTLEWLRDKAVEDYLNAQVSDTSKAA